MLDLLEVKWFFDGYSILLGLDEDGLPGKAEVWKDNAMNYEDNQANFRIDSEDKKGIG